MAKFLYSLGRFAAQKAWAVVGIWALLLAATAGAYAAFGGSLVNTFTIPGSQTQQLADQLKDKYPSANQGLGQVVVTTDNGTPITAEQKQAFSDSLASADNIPGLASVVDPFKTEQEKVDNKAKLDAAKKQIDAAPQQFKDAQAKIDQAQQEIDSGQAQLDAAPEQIAQAQQQIDAGFAQLTSGEQELQAAISQASSSQEQVNQARSQLEAGQGELNLAQDQLNQAIAQASAAGLLDAQRPTFDAQQAQITAKQQELDAQNQQLAASQAQIDAAQAEIARNQQTLAANRTQLESSQQELDQKKAALPSQQKELDSAKEELKANKEKLAQNEAGFPAQKAEYDYNSALFNLMKDYKSVSEDGTTAVAILSFDQEAQNIPQDTKDQVMEHFESADLKGLKVSFDKNIAENMTKILGVGEVIGVVVALLVLLVMLGTLVAAGLPVLMALVGVAVGVLAALAFSSLVEMTSITPVLGIMLALAVGIDYSLFILNRHRTNLAQGMSFSQSIALANGTSGNAVVFAGTTVVIALLALNVTGIPFLAVMGNVAAVCVAVAVLVAVTLTPAALAIIDRAALPKRAWARIEQAHQPGVNAEDAAAAAAAAQQYMDKPRGWIKLVTGHPIMTLLATTMLLVFLALPMGSMRLGLPDASSADANSTQYITYKLVDQKFGEGVNGPVITVADFPEGINEQQAKNLQVAVGEHLADQDNVKTVVPVGIADDRSLAVFQVIPTAGPNAESTIELVNNLRSTTVTSSDGQEASLGVTGQTGGNIDISQILAGKLPLYLGIVLGLSFIILILVFRSIMVPFMATVGFLFSVLASFGAVVAIYQWGWLGTIFGVHDPGPVLSFLPTLMIGILFGLAMDYQVFLVSGMREAYVHGKEATVAIITGFNSSVRVVVAAAIIMITVFAGFIHAELTMIRPLGFGLAFGVLVDAFLVRMTFIPAAMQLLGQRAWWMPAWLDRLLPDMDVEGASLDRDEPQTVQG